MGVLEFPTKRLFLKEKKFQYNFVLFGAQFIGKKNLIIFVFSFNFGKHLNIHSLCMPLLL